MANKVPAYALPVGQEDQRGFRGAGYILPEVPSMSDLEVTTPRFEQFSFGQTAELSPSKRCPPCENQARREPVNTNHSNPKKPDNRALIAAVLNVIAAVIQLANKHWPF